MSNANQPSGSKPKRVRLATDEVFEDSDTEDSDTAITADKRTPEIDNDKIKRLMEKHAPQLQDINSYLHQFIMDYISISETSHTVCKEKELKLQAEIRQLSNKIEDTRRNSRIIVENLKQNTDMATEEAIKVAKNVWEAGQKEKMQSYVEKTVQEKRAFLKEHHETVLSNISTKYQKTLDAAVKRLTDNKNSSIEDAMKELRKVYGKRIKSLKKTQWCALCLKRATFRCCWNTNYCKEECQQKHWLQHATDHYNNICPFAEENPNFPAQQATSSKMAPVSKETE